MIPLNKRHREIQALFDLRTDVKKRQELGFLALFGTKIIREWQGKRHAVYRTKSCPYFNEDDILVEEEALQWASGLISSPDQMCAAIVDKPNIDRPLKANRALILDGLQDPGNLGTLMRSALAFGVEAIILIEPSCDPFNDKAIRASAGACLHLPLWRTSLKQLLETIDEPLASGQLQLLVADTSDGALPVSTQGLKPMQRASQPSATWIAIGSEGQGVSPDLLKRGQRVFLPMDSRVESLNAGVAGSILAYLIFGQHASKVSP